MYSFCRDVSKNAVVSIEVTEVVKESPVGAE